MHFIPDGILLADVKALFTLLKNYAINFVQEANSQDANSANVSLYSGGF